METKKTKTKCIFDWLESDFESKNVTQVTAEVDSIYHFATEVSMLKLFLEPNRLKEEEDPKKFVNRLKQKVRNRLNSLRVKHAYFLSAHGRERLKLLYEDPQGVLTSIQVTIWEYHELLQYLDTLL